ncbi:hypothetical protein NVP1121O_245 [Vibrio phage 1.121.O._10N.286.46.C4]|nr:hypothetical protein NVP1121O_245 [Vibrio phage 1.121.O._10N.286.46.C4]
MEIKIIQHKVRDNLFSVSSDLYKILQSTGTKGLNSISSTFKINGEIVEDPFLDNMTMMVPNRKYFDKIQDEHLEALQMFAKNHLGD